MFLTFSFTKFLNLWCKEDRRGLTTLAKLLKVVFTQLIRLEDHVQEIYPTLLFHERPLNEQVLLRRGKHRSITRPKSLTIGGTAASREAWLEARRNYTTGSLYTNIPESPLEPSDESEFTPAYVSLRRKASRSFRSSLH